MVPDQKNITGSGLHTEIKHWHAGGINPAFIPLVENRFDLMFFAAPNERDWPLSLPVFVTGQNFDVLKFHVFATVDG
jgi:hypothetical protein